MTLRKLRWQCNVILVSGTMMIEYGVGVTLLSGYRKLPPSFFTFWICKERRRCGVSFLTLVDAHPPRPLSRLRQKHRKRRKRRKRRRWQKRRGIKSGSFSIWNPQLSRPNGFGMKSWKRLSELVFSKEIFLLVIHLIFILILGLVFLFLVLFCFFFFCFLVFFVCFCFFVVFLFGSYQ